ncbi:hypothetical protein HHI36_006472 [Cryptolaemus montrouzieri]|uniref:C2H2-type domain-containing protein n=1 Tax=Cryptolaemus montrouzieri TaxID=559131 RepID=A0ABD2NX84_9CUCU
MIEHINLDSKVKIEPDYVLKSEDQKKPQISEKEVKTEILLDSKTNLKDETFGYVDIENLKPEILLTEEDFHVENYGWDETKDEISQDADDIDEIGDSHLPVRLQMLTQNAENPLGETVKWYNCENCSYHTKWKHHLERHKQVHEARVSHQKSFKCLTCGFITKYKHALLKHSTLEHGEWFKCEECKYETKWKRCYNQHLLNHKGGQIWYHCEICSYKSKWKYHLKRHMVTHE